MEVKVVEKKDRTGMCMVNVFSRGVPRARNSPWQHFDRYFARSFFSELGGGEAYFSQLHCSSRNLCI